MPNSTSPRSASILTLPVKQLVKGEPLFINASATVAQAARAMQNARAGSILVASEPPGIVTDRDLRGRVLGAGRGPETLVTEIMSRPLIALDSHAPTFSALRIMLEKNIHHLPLTEEGKIVGVISASDLLLQEGKSPLYLHGAIESLTDAENFIDYAGEITALVEALFRGGLGAMQVSQIVSSLNDALVNRLIDVTIASLGPAPAPYAWIVFGSEGRLEQTLLTDQDNALIYGEESEAARAYFATVAKQVVDGLIRAGFPPCAGGFMATRWCKPLAAWQELFRQWTHVPKPDALLDASIFFDLRRVAGELSIDSLEDIIVAAKSQRLFLANMARGALEFRPPLGFFDRLRSERGKVDLKRGGIASIVALARIASLAAGSLERSTLERLRVAAGSGLFLSREDATALGEIFPFLFNLRFAQQVKSAAAKDVVDNQLPLGGLSKLTRRHLKEAFVLIKRIQDAIRAEWHLDKLV
jgi:CBS domain-containing protein